MTTALRTDPARFRHVLGHYPTGVVAVTAFDGTGRPVGLAVGSFASVSLSPALVTFFVDRASTTWPAIRDAGRFCANVLASSQHDVCAALARKGGDKFDGLAWTPSAGTGSPLIAGAAAWIDCTISAVHPAGDHEIVLGEVLDLDVATEPHGLDPLIFHRGRYSRLAHDAA